MPAIMNTRELAQMVRCEGIPGSVEILTEALEAGELRPRDFSIRALAENLIEGGREWIDAYMSEANWAVDSTAFATITQNIVVSELMQKYQAPSFVFTPLVPTVPSRQKGGMIPGVTELGDRASVVEEGMPYRPFGVAEDWLRLPRAEKRGFTVPITREALFFDQTGLILERAGDVGNWMGVNKEKRVIDAIIDKNRLQHRWSYRDNGPTATYSDTVAGTHPFDNLVASNALVDWTDIDAAEQAFIGMTDPQTGEPITVEATDIIVAPSLKPTAMRIVNAIEIRFGDGASNTTQTVSRNPVTPYGIRTSQLLAARMTAGSEALTTWYVGNIGRAFRYIEHWPITVTRAAQNSEAEFRQDIAVEFKVSEFGEIYTIEPRFMVKNTA